MGCLANWGVAGNIVIAWFLTLPAAALVSASCTSSWHCLWEFTNAWSPRRDGCGLALLAAARGMLSSSSCTCGSGGASSCPRIRARRRRRHRQDQLHAQATLVFVASALPAEFPGLEGAQPAVETECISAFDAYVGSDYARPRQSARPG